MKKIFLFLIIFSYSALWAQNGTFRTQIFDKNVKTLQTGVEGVKFSLPIIELKGKKALELSFDELSHTAHTYSYRVLHCNADWQLSALQTTEYLSGFTQGYVSDYQLSVSTLTHYTHYRLSLPNNDMQFKVSGNYVVQVFENDVNTPILQSCFSVVEPRVEISGNIRGNTDTELNGKSQQLDFEVNTSGYNIQNPQQDIKVVVRQNERIDNQVTNLQPTYFSSSKLSFINNRKLIFEGGNEYHRFDVSSVYAASYGLAGVHYNRDAYDAYLVPYTRPSTYLYEPDVNGKFLINFQEAFSDIDTEADYVRVHFAFDAAPFFDGQMYVGGDWNYNLQDNNSRMQYVVEDKQYTLTAFLKQGGYNYQYWFVPKNQTVATTTRTDGSFWQTQNEYTIYVYHRAWGERYDKLIGVQVIENK